MQQQHLRCPSKMTWSRAHLHKSAGAREEMAEEEEKEKEEEGEGSRDKKKRRRRKRERGTGIKRGGEGGRRSEREEEG